MTSRRTRVRSTASSVPVITSSQTRSVSRPDQPPLRLIPSGGVRFTAERGLLTTAICASVSDAISSKRRRTSGLRVGLEKGESRISERETLIAARCCRGVKRDLRKLRQETYLDGTVLEDKTSREHDLLVCACDVKIVGRAMVNGIVRNMAAMELHGHDDEFLNCICVRGKMLRQKGRFIWFMVVEISRGSSGQHMSRPTWIDKGGCVGIHRSGEGMRRKGITDQSFSKRRQYIIAFCLTSMKNIFIPSP